MNRHRQTDSKPVSRAEIKRCIESQDGQRLKRQINWLVSLFFGAVLLVVLGFWLLLDPDLRHDPNRITLSNLVPAACTFVVGFGVIGLVVYITIRYKKGYLDSVGKLLASVRENEAENEIQE